MMRTRSSLAKLFKFVVVLVFVLSPIVSQAKEGNEQGQIILLNDSASALEDTNPGLSKELTKLADEKEKDWEDKNANKNVLPIVVTDKYKQQLQEQIKLIKEAEGAVAPTYPLIAKSLDQMINDLNDTIQGKKPTG